jgi:hypothetical protein
MIPFIGGLGYAAWYITQNQDAIDKTWLLVTFGVIIFVFWITANTIWYHVSESVGEKVTQFEISEKGFKIDDKQFSLESIDPQVVEPMIEKASLPVDQWNQPRPEDGSLLELNLDSKQGKIKLQFAEEYTRQKMIRALEEYFKERTDVAG